MRSHRPATFARLLLGVLLGFIVPAVRANTAVTLGTVSQVTGPQDLDLAGQMIYAINFSANDPVRTVAGVQFIPDTQTIVGAVLYGPNNVTPWQNRPEFGASADANELEEILHDIRWASGADKLSAQLAVTAGDEYKLQVLFSANGFEDRKWDIRVNGQNAVDEVTSLGASPGQTYSVNRATLFTYQFTAPSGQVLVEMGNLFGQNEGGDRNPIWQALTLERVTIPPTPDDVTLSPAQFFPTQTAAIGTFAVTDGKSPPVSHTITLVSGTGATDNAKFTVSGMQLLPQPFDFSGVPPGTVYSIRVRAEDAAAASRFIEKVFSVTVAAPHAPTAVTLDTTTVGAASVPGMLAGNLGATDQDSFDRHTFSLVGGAGSTDNALFVVSGSELRFAQTLSTGITSISIRLRATDLAGLFVETAFTLPVAAPQLRINEFLAGNTTGLTDEALVPQDWIEIRNTLAQSIDIAGWYLTDDPDNLTKWQFPSRVIGANGYLVVFADGRGTPPGGSSQLHTNFSLSGSGERILLVKPDGVTVASEINPPEQFPNVTYGYNAAGTQLGYLLTPTPGAANSALTTYGQNAVSFSQQRGLYSANFSLTLTASAPGSTIRYTLDGTKPTAGTGTVYVGPISISPDTTGTKRGSRIVRAIAVNAQAAYAPVNTHTYLFINGTAGPTTAVTGQSNLVTSITTHPTYGPLLDDALLALPSLSVILPSGLSTSENEGSIELMNPAGVEAGFQINCGINATGTTSLGSPKLSMAAKFRLQYGDAKLDYPVFAVGSTAPDSAAVEFKELRLRSHSHDTFYWLGTAENPPVPYGSPSVTRSGDAQLMRNLWMDEMQIRMGQPGKRGRQVHLYLNGEYRGIYHVHEHADEDFMASYYPGSGEDFHFTGGATTGSNHGNGDVWTVPWNSLKNSLGNYTEAKRWVDVTNLADYMVQSYYAGNDWDWWPQRNWAAAGPKLPDKGGWKFFQQDSDISLQDIVANNTDQNVPDGVFYTLMNHEEFRVLFRDRAYKHCFHGGALTPAVAGAFYDARINEIFTAIIAETARWQPGSSVAALPWDRDQEWVNEWNYLKNTFFPQRSAALIAQLRARPGWWPVEPAEMNQHGGSVPGGFNVTFTGPAGTIYYTLDGSDPRLTGGAVAGTAAAYSGPIAINASRTVRARVLNAGNWSALNEATFFVTQDYTKLVMTEAHYHPLPNGAIDGDEYEFVEFKNIGGTTIDLGGLNFTNGITYTFPLGSTLAPGSFWVIAPNAAAFAARYPGRTLNGIYTGRLSNSGERLTLVDGIGAQVMNFVYDDILPWPISADGQGFSVVARTPAIHTDPGNALSWRASANIGGSPGADDPADSIAGVLINEILTNSAAPFTDTIELFNPSTSAAAIGDWWLSDSVSVPKKYRIPTGTMIAAGGYATFSEAQFNPGGGTSFALNQNGGQLYLFSGDAAGNLTGYAHGIEFQAADQNVSFGRFLNSLGYESFLAQSARTFGSENSGPLIGPLVINEIQYNPPAGYDEFVEIRNISGAAVNLWDAANPANTWQINGISFNFPGGMSIPAGGYALIVGIDPAVFRTKYQVPAAVQIFGPYAGMLDNGGERIELRKPMPPYVNGTGQTIIPYVIVDSVRFSDVGPWPTGAAGGGSSLQRQSSLAPADDSANWFASGISPGAASVYNSPPAITLLAPLNGATFTLPAAITLAADAVDTDGYISKVEFFDGAAKIAEVTTAPFIFTWTTATAGTHSISAKATDGSLGITTSATASITVNSGTGSVTGTGWRGEYFKDTNASTHLTVTDNTVRTRTDTTINFNDGTGWPNTLFPGNSEIPAIGTDLFSVRWSAQFLPPSTASYNFYATSAAGVRLYVGGQLVINNWTAHALTTNSASVSLNGGQLYDIVLEFFETSLGAVVSLEYESSGASPPITRAILPASRVYPAGAPIILKQPAAFALTSGSAAVFSVLAAGAQPLSYQWRFNGADIAGATGQSLVLPLPLLTQAGNYSVRITNSLGTVTSSNAALTIPDSDGDGLANYWETLHGLSTSVNDAALDPDEDGKTNLQEFTAGTNPLDPASFLNLIVTPVSGGNTLSFTAQSYKAYGLQYQTGGGPWITLQYYAAEPAQRNITYTDTTTETRTYRVVTPAIPPSIATHPANVTLTNSSFATISVSANGDQPFSYQWQFNGADIAGATSAGLTINSPLVTQSGQYRVRVTNSFGNITSNAATFTVYDGDTDGTPNYWESANGLSVSVADSTLDSDGDGMSNLAEFLANTNPKNASSRLAVAISPAAGAGSTLSFTAQPYRTYGIQYRDSLTSGAWTTLQTYPAAASAQTINYTDPSAPAARFYRIITP